MGLWRADSAGPSLAVGLERAEGVVGNKLQAIEIGGAVDAEHQLHLDAPLPIAGPSRVRVIILFPEEADIAEDEWLHAAASSPAFAFLNDPREDIYTFADGQPFNDQG